LIQNRNIIDQINIFIDKMEKKRLITELYNLINNTLLRCSEKTTEIKYNSKRHKFWWDPSLNQTHTDLCQAYRLYKASNFDEEFKLRYMELKKLFRKKKRLYMKLKSNRNLQKISKYFTYDKDGFWHAINKLEKKNNTINAPIDKLKDHYHDLYNKKNNIIPGNIENSEKELNEIIKIKHKEKLEYSINSSKIAEILHELPNNRSPADDGLSYEHFKHCN
jgi:hypothetical protein